MTVQSDCDDDLPLDALVQKRKNENNNGNHNNTDEQQNDKTIIPLTGILIIMTHLYYSDSMTHKL